MIPNHVAFIMDGNGRWATQKGLKRTDGHRAGTENIRSIIRHSKDLGIKHLTFYAFSTENFRRPLEEVQYLMELIKEYFLSEIDELFTEGARIHVIGELERFSFPIRKVLTNAMEKTKENDTIHIYLALAYGGRQEIVRAVNRLLESGSKSISEKEFEEMLYTKGVPDPDLVIRTSGEERISNFLLYQIAYSEFYFTDVLWPDFSVAEYDKALLEFSKRTRRFGGLQDAKTTH
ncbi:polyprenyl diphosphate synthase [Guggenheimella bovis]